MQYHAYTRYFLLQRWFKIKLFALVKIGGIWIFVQKLKLNLIEFEIEILKKGIRNKDIWRNKFSKRKKIYASATCWKIKWSILEKVFQYYPRNF